MIQNQQERIIQPDDRFGSCPHQIADDAVISRHDPTFSLSRRADAFAEHVERSLLPVWFPMKRVEFDEVEIESRGDSFREC